MSTYMPEVPTSARIGFQDLVTLDEHSEFVMQEIRSGMLLPNTAKKAPMVSLSTLAQLCGVEKSKVVHRITKGDLPSGSMDASGYRRVFTIEEAHAWTSEYRIDKLRPKNGASAIAIAIANFKGGVSKTSTTMNLAQGLNLLGHKVLCIDCDPQGSLTNLFGLLPSVDVEDSDTILDVCLGHSNDLSEVVRKTYWPGIDLIPSAPSLFGAEFGLPVRQLKDNNFQFWNVLNLALEDLRDVYDVILMDTPPSLSYITVNSLIASNGILLPLPPQMLDFASAAQFWSLISDLYKTMIIDRDGFIEYDFVHVLLSKVDTHPHTDMVRQWAQNTYGDKLLPIEIPSTVVTSGGATEFRTVYDYERYEGSQKTLKRAREAYDAFVLHMERSIRMAWKRQVESAFS